VEGPALSSLRAYKFLRPGAVGPFSGFSWPAPAPGEVGEWVDAATAVGHCFDGIHACEARHLPRWIWEELWEIELEGGVEPHGHKLRAPRGRLLRRVDGWGTTSAWGFAGACAERAAEHGAAASGDDAAIARAMAADCETGPDGPPPSEDPYRAARAAAVNAYIAAMTALRAGGRGRHEQEREWQAEWLARELGL
jgi:hypothetical protein